MSNQPLSFGYCTNVHAGTSLAEAQANLLKYACGVRDKVSPGGVLPVGLWLAEQAATTLLEEGEVEGFGEWLAEHRLLPYTFNGFPQGDFHQAVVKHAVYEPTWTCDTRRRHTLCLAEILAHWIPAGSTGSISTLPLGWPHAPWHAENMKAAADNLLNVAVSLNRLAQQSQREIVLAIEPEPGCVLNIAPEIVEFFEHYLFSGPDAEVARRHLTVCHDICHSGVMFEPQAMALEMYRQAGIRIGKVQVSSAVHVPWDQYVGDQALQQATLAQLKTFNEPKYLHQTSRPRPHADPHVRHSDLLDDLSVALDRWLAADSAPDSFPEQPWRIHFHVPIFVDQFEHLSTTRADIHEAIEYLDQHADAQVAGRPWFTGHYEVETYAWPVLPASLAEPDLAAGISRELEYLAALLKR